MDDVTLTEFLGAALGELDGFEWHPAGEPFTADAVAVVYGRIPPDPDRAVGLRVYATTDDDVEHNHSRRVQVRLRGARGAPGGADALALPVYLALTNLSRVGGISGVTRESMAPLGADGNDRDQRSDNYTITLDNTEASS